MLSVRRPADAAIRFYVARQEEAGLSYATSGMTRDPAPPGWDVGAERIVLGAGAATYERARAAIERWAMFDLGWVELCWSDDAPREGRSVAVLARLGGFWSLNACRVVYIDRSADEIERYAFAYGTLGDHLETGEERFEVSRDPATDKVAYAVTAYSRPRHWLARVGGPFARQAQTRFRRGSARAMQLAVSRG